MNSLVTVFVKNDLANQSLCDSALTGLTTKSLFALGDYSDIPQIVRKIKSMVGVSIAEARVSAVTTSLVAAGEVQKSSDKYKLRPTNERKIAAAIAQRTEEIRSVYGRYFDNIGLNYESFQNLFEQMIVAFFARYNIEWFNKSKNNFTGNKKFSGSPDSVFDSAFFRKLGVDYSTQKAIIEQFLQFLKSDDYADLRLLWQYSTTLFASKIISSSLFADKTIKDLFSDASIVIDTNVLMHLDLEKSKFHQAYRHIEKILQALGTRFVYFHISKEEFTSATSHMIAEMQNSYANYPLSTLSQSSDVFMQTALERGCQTLEDFETFFTAIAKVPDKFGDLTPIEELDYKELVDAIEAGREDRIAQSRMNQIFRRRRAYDKSRAKLEHDACLVHGTVYLRKNQNAWILTLDRTLDIYSAENCNDSQYPVVISVDALINLLSVSDGGIDFDPEDFVPLFGNLLHSDIAYYSDVFQLEDLVRMHEIEATVLLLSDEDQIGLAKAVNRKRIKGESDKSIALEIQRYLSANRLSEHDELLNTKTRFLEAEQLGKEQSQTMTKVRENFFVRRRKEIAREIVAKRTRACILWGLLQFVVVYSVIWFFQNFSNQVFGLFSWQTVVGLASNLLASFLVSRFFWYPLLLKRSPSRDEIERRIKEEYDELKK